MRIKNFAKFSKVGLETLVLFGVGRNLLVGVKYCRVVTSSEGLADRRQGRRRFLADQEHRHLPREDDVLVAALALHLLEADVVEARHGPGDGIDRERARLR